MADYQVDPDDLFSEGESPPRPPSPKPLRPPPIRPAARPQSLNSHPTSSAFSRGPSQLNAPFRSQYNDRPYRPPSSHPPKPRSYMPDTRPVINGPHATFHGRDPYRRQYPHPNGDQPIRSLGRGRARTIPSHAMPAKPNQIDTSKLNSSLNEAASILPEHTREKVLREEEKRRAAASSERKRPSKRRRPEDPSAKRAVIQNANRSRQGQFQGLAALLAGASASSSLIQLDPNRSKRHRDHRAPDERTVYAGVVMTKEKKEREEREREEAKRRLVEEEKEVDEHFAQLRINERNERARCSNKWRGEETVAAGMREAYRMAFAEKQLFGRPEDHQKFGKLTTFGLTLRQGEHDAKVVQLMTIEIEEI